MTLLPLPADDQAMLDRCFELVGDPPDDRAFLNSKYSRFLLQLVEDLLHVSGHHIEPICRNCEEVIGKYGTSHNYPHGCRCLYYDECDHETKPQAFARLLATRRKERNHE